MLSVADLRCEYRSNPLGIDTPRPRFSWKLQSDRRGTVQAAYQLQVDTHPDFLTAMWDTDKVESDASIQLEYAGDELEPRTRYHVRVRVWDNYGEVSKWQAGTFETAMLGSPWQAEWITCDLPKDPPDHIPPWILRRWFTVEKPVRRARAYATALGLYSLSINGKPADDTLLNPGWTSYNHWLQYQTYDVTDCLVEGSNRLEVLLGEGWYSGDICFAHFRNFYGDKNALLLELHLEYADGTGAVVCTDQGFRASTGPILLSTLYNGEIYDARLADEILRQWQPVQLLDYRKDHLTGGVNLPVRAIEERRPVALIETPNGERVLDMGQNMVGYLRFRVKGERGKRVVLRHAEVLDKDGNFYNDNIREARQEIIYTLRGGGGEWFEPHFTFQGFRYVKVVEHPGELELNDFVGVVIHTDMAVTGGFSCSAPLVNQLQHNIVWGQKGNFVDVPTDCPQRDERLGWTADAQVFMPTACFNMDCALFFTKYLRDLRADQFENGAVPFVVPNVLPKDWFKLKETGYDEASATWGDAATIMPWALYMAYGDTRVLAESYDSMAAWIRYIESRSTDYIWRGGPQLGDWVALDAHEGSYLGATPTDYIATAYFAYSTKLMEKTAKVLGKTDDVKRYGGLYKKITAAFRAEFFPEGRPFADGAPVDTQTGYILPLAFGIVNAKERKACVEGLAAHLERNNKHLTTGFVGTPFLCRVLSENGHGELAYDLLFQEDYPSWLYQVKMGATTVWEHWDGIKPDGTMWSADMNSFNHYAYGSVGEWLYRVVAGIDLPEDGPAYKRITLRPQITDRLDEVRCHHESMYGRVAVHWRRGAEGLTIEVEIPANTTATVHLPTVEVEAVTEGGRPLAEAEEIVITGQRGGESLLELGSGVYAFAIGKL